MSQEHRDVPCWRFGALCNLRSVIGVFARALTLGELASYGATPAAGCYRPAMSVSRTTTVGDGVQATARSNPPLPPI